MVLIVDSRPVHCSVAVREWVESTDGRVWKIVKYDRLDRVQVTGPHQFISTVVRTSKHLQPCTSVLRGFFQDPHLAFITDATRVD